MDLKIRFGIKFCSRYSFPEVCAPENHGRTIVARVQFGVKAGGAQELPKKGRRNLAWQLLLEPGPPTRVLLVILEC